MAVRVNREELLQTLARVQPGLSARDTVEQASCFVLQDGWVATFNDEIACRSKCGLAEHISGAVHAEPLLRVLENITDDEVEIEAAEGELLVRGKRKKAGVRLEADIILPLESVERPQEWKELPEDFGKALAQVIPVVGTNQEEFVTVCVHLHPNWIEATDRFQVSRYKLDLGISRSFLVRGASLAHVGPLSVSRFSETENWVHFRNKHVIISIRRNLDDYPDLTSHLEFPATRTTLPRGGVEAAKLAGVFSADDKDNDKVTVTLKEGRMVVRGEGARGWASQVLETTYAGEEVSFYISSKVLTQVIQNHKECEISAERLRAVGENWVYMTVLGKHGA